MCGISGAYLTSRNKSAIVDCLIKGGYLSHRGPDRYGHWKDKDGFVFLQHYRLSIVDLSSNGNQPMQSADQRFTIVFNGEIYNHRQIRSELGISGLRADWRGESDTETLVEAISAWGINIAIKKCIGMFAFAVYDNIEKTLSLARDRMGEKPLYYGYIEDALCFASEIKVIKQISSARLKINRQALLSYMQDGYVSGSASIYQGVFKLPQGTYTVFEPTQIREKQIPGCIKYWDIHEIVKNQSGLSSHLSSNEVLSRIDSLLEESIKCQMLADVPIGAFLSGGIDSSLVASKMQRLSEKKINTFTIGFSDIARDEAKSANEISKYIGSYHTEAYFSNTDLIELVPNLSTVFCEPFADSSQLPTLLVSKIASKHVKVVLGGDGGDELFVGYQRYKQLITIEKIFRTIPPPTRLLLSKCINSKNLAAKTIRIYCYFFNKHKNISGDRFIKLTRMIKSRTVNDVGLAMLKNWDGSVVRNVDEVGSGEDSDEAFNSGPQVERIIFNDLCKYLPDDILVKIDRTAMAYGLEGRSPFLDHRLVEFALSLTIEQRMLHGTPKGALRELLKRYLPTSLFDRPKRGFGCPVGDWLRGPLREWGEDLIRRHSVSTDDLLDMEQITNCWEEHVSAKQDWGYRMWIALVFLGWLDENGHIEK